jgi:hypothetical protein
MKINRWWFSVLFVLTLVLLAAGVAIATEQESPVDQQQAAAEAAAVAEADQAVQSEAVDEPAAEPEVATVTEEGAEVVPSQLMLPAAPPPSLQTLVDERRDQLRERREAQFDAMSARYAYMSPWMATYDRTMDVYRDAMRQLHRRQRDYSQLHHDTWMDAMCPWSKPQRDWSRRRSYLTQMEQLDRQEAWNAWLAARPYGFAGPIPW